MKDAIIITCLFVSCVALSVVLGYIGAHFIADVVDRFKLHS